MDINIGEKETVYKHYKGGIYTVLSENAIIEEDLSRAVIYKNSKNQIWIRKYDNFHEIITIDGKQVKRFELIVAE